MPALETLRPLRFGDCDPSGIAYFPCYLDMLAGVLEELFAAAGASFPWLMGERGMGTPTVRLEVEFKRPGFHGNRLDWHVAIARLGRSSAELHYKVRARGEVLWSARQTIVLTALSSHKAIPWPDDIRAGLSQFIMENDDASHSAA
jgi:4-hydroxybenzoyl-CoA thioesterase